MASINARARDRKKPAGQCSAGFPVVDVPVGENAPEQLAEAGYPPIDD